MKRLIITIFLVLTLTACSGAVSSPTPLPTVSLDAVSPGGPSAGTVTASGEVVPLQHVRLSFPLTGIVKSVEVQEGDRVTAGQPLVALDTTILEAKVAEAEAAVATAETQVRYLRRVGSGQEQLDSAQASVDRAVALLASAKATLAQATLTAPMDGMVAALDIAPGEVVTPGQIVVQIGDLSAFQIETTDLSELDAPRVKPGQAVEVYVEALDARIAGKVADIARVSSTVGGDVVYKVTVALDEQVEGLMWGMSADVTITTE
ncbi:MAG: efflux RND transporter periplasmic adaptor subunit [Chloroflexota bacterium]